VGGVERERDVDLLVAIDGDRYGIDRREGGGSWEQELRQGVVGDVEGTKVAAAVVGIEAGDAARGGLCGVDGTVEYPRAVDFVDLARVDRVDGHLRINVRGGARQRLLTRHDGRRKHVLNRRRGQAMLESFQQQLRPPGLALARSFFLDAGTFVFEETPERRV